MTTIGISSYPAIKLLAAAAATLAAELEAEAVRVDGDQITFLRGVSICNQHDVDTRFSAGTTFSVRPSYLDTYERIVADTRAAIAPRGPLPHGRLEIIRTTGSRSTRALGTGCFDVTLNGRSQTSELSAAHCGIMDLAVSKVAGSYADVLRAQAGLRVMVWTDRQNHAERVVAPRRTDGGWWLTRPLATYRRLSA